MFFSFLKKSATAADDDDALITESKLKINFYTTHSKRCWKLQEGVQCLLEASCSNIKKSSSSLDHHDSNTIIGEHDKLQTGFFNNKTPALRIASKYPSQNATKGKAAAAIRTSNNSSISFTSSSTTTLISHFAYIFLLFILFFTFIPHHCSATDHVAASVDNDNLLPFDLTSSPHKQKPSTHFLSPNSYSSLNPDFSNNNFDDIEEPSEIVIFQRWIRSSPSQNDFKIIENSRKDEHFMIDQIFNSTNSIQFQCKAFLHSYFTSDISNETTITLPVSWVTDDGKVLSENDMLEISEKPNKNLKIRCKANLKDLDVMLDGSLLSRSIYFSHKPYNPIKVQPEMIHIVPGSVARFVCHWPVTSPSEVFWKHNGTIVKPSKLIKIGTIQGKSVLHILSAAFEHSGGYRCVTKSSNQGREVVEEESEASNLKIDEFGTASQGIELPLTSSAPLHGKVIFECLLPGTQGVQWLLEKRSYDKKGETLPRIESKVLGNGTILILKNVSTKFHGIIKCLVEVANNTLMTQETDFKVFNETYNYDTAVYTPIERKQGTPVSFRCETYDILAEAPEMAQWYLNGKPIERTPNVKVTRSTVYSIGHSDLIIAIAEAENEGLYTCIISNDQHERVHQLLLQVDVTTNETITNLKVTTDHRASCINLDFDLPPTTDLSWAHFTPFFVVIHERNSTKSLNSLPLPATCNKRLHCEMKICQPSGMLEDATEYVFRISMVLSGSGTVITPLSKPAYATTWDSQAKKSVPITFFYNKTENTITVEWEMPTDINGKVESFAVQVINYSEKMSNLFANMNRSYFERPPEDRKYQIRNLTDPFAYKIRVTPLTRKPKLPVARMPLLEYFPFFLITSEHATASSSVDPELPIPSFNLTQIHRDPTINISWSIPSSKIVEISKIIIKYQHVAASQAKFISIERPINDKFTELDKGIEVGLVYQICAAFIRKTDLAQSAWRCQTIPLKNVFNNLIYTTLKDAWEQKQLPPAVICENDKCRCIPSKINEGGMRVEWDAPAPRSFTDVEDLQQIPEIQYIVHYTFNETDPSSKEYEFPANEGDLFAELPPLLPNTTYRIMIETRNELNDKVDGTFFTCKTSETSPLPPPKNFYYEFINATHLKFTWTPYSKDLKQSPPLSGYTIYWQADNKPSLPIFIPGSESSSHIIGGMRPEPQYQAYIVSRSIKFEDSVAKSPKLSIRMPPELMLAFEEMEQSSTRSPTKFSNFYRDPEISFTIYIIAGSTICILLFLAITCCCYFWCCIPLWKRRKQARLNALQRGHSNASSKISLDTDDNAAQAMLDVEAFQIPILNIPPDPPNFPENADTKGPPGGPRPLGNRRFRQMMHDESFKKQMLELNLDPTGFGICPATRDDCLRHIQSEEDRKFHELVERERKDIEKRRIREKRKKPLTSKFSNIAETSFITESSQLTPNPSIHNNDDAYSIGGGTSSQKYSASNQELNRSLGNIRNSEGLSPRSHSIAIYRRFFPRKRQPSIPDVKKALMIQPPQISQLQHHQNQQQQNQKRNYRISNELKPDSSNHFINHHHQQQQRLIMNSPSSLPNLADSGIVFDDLSTSGGTTTSTLNPLSQLPTIHQGSCSGSITLVEDVLPKKSHSMLNQHLQDCRRERNSVLENSNTATLVP